MESPVIVDSATKFGRGLDLDRDFPGFPFDDDGFGRRADIRSHLDDLAARHPEFADHLLGPPWADVPFGGGGSLHRNRNRRTSTDRNNHPDEDTRSQTSGGSGVSSHSSESEEQKQQKPPKSTGLRNNHTLDIGQHQHNMENPQQQRNVRSMSAPPENRNNQNDQPGKPRFVSKVEITPGGGSQTANQTQSEQSPQPQQTQREKSPAPQQKPQPQSHSSQGNVRHIPIFVEGRDEPVIAKDTDRRAPPAPQPPVDEPDFPRRQQSPPHFHRPSHFSQQHFNKHPPGWSTFQDPFFEHTTGQWPPRHARDSPFGEFRRPQQPEKSRAQQTHHEPPQTKRQAPPQQQHPHNETQPEAPPKPRQQVQPKDPLEKVALVQKEVDALTEQVKQYTGNSRKDKQYMYLDEMLTRELIKLDDIDTEGKENVRQARKQAIKSIQESISLLESKAPLPGQQQESQPEENVDQPMESTANEDKPIESMETSEAPATEEQKAIPLPPPSSPTKAAAPQETQEEPAFKTEEKQPEQMSVTPTAETPASLEAKPEPEQVAANASETSLKELSKVEENKPSEVPMDSSAAPAEATPQQQQQSQDVEMRQPSPAKEVVPPIPKPEKASETPAVPAQEEKKDSKPEEPKQPEAKTETTATTEKVKKEPPPVPAKPGKSPKKAKKTPKKQPEPVSEAAIPMPAPGQ